MPGGPACPRSRELTARSRLFAEEAEAVARVRGTSLNAVLIDALAAEVARVKADENFLAAVKKVVDRDRELLERLSR